MKALIFSKKFLIPTVVITIIYIVTITYLMNGSIVADTIIGSYSLTYKLSLLLALLKGMETAMSLPALVILFLTALLTGANLSLLFQKIGSIKNIKNIRLIVGGNTVLGIAALSGGCGACGISVLSLLGLGGSILYLPFRGVELSYLAVVLLLISFFVLLKSTTEKPACAVIKG